MASLLQTLLVTGAARGGQAASQSDEFVRLGELLALLSGVAPLTHTHVAADITDFEAAVLALLEAHDSGVETLMPGGGLARGASGLYVRPDVVAYLGHTHVAADITDFDAGVVAVLGDALEDSQSIYWDFYSGVARASVRLKPSGGLGVSAGGLVVDFGTGVNQAARGNHTHAQLHDPVEFVPSASLDIEIAGQIVDMEVKVSPTGGLIIGASGVENDFGTGHNQVARGDHTHDQLHDPVTVVNTTGLTLGLSGQVLSGVPNCDPTPDNGYGKANVGPRGLRIVLGDGADEAAPGNHGHDVATHSDPGFMSAADKIRLDTLASGVSSSGVAQVVNYVRESVFIVGEYLMGAPSWPGDVRLLAAELIAWVGQGTATVLTLEVGGSLTGITLTLPAGSAGTEDISAVDLGQLTVPGGQRVRWKITSGPAAEAAAWKAQLAMRVRV